MNRLIILVFTLLLMVSFSATGQMKTKSEVETLLTNFSISIIFNAQRQDTYNFRQASNDKATFFEVIRGSHSHKIEYYDFIGMIAYNLDVHEKSGESMRLRSAGRYKGFMPYVTNHLFIHENYKNDLKKTSSERLLGRNTTVYTITFPNAEMKLWIDDEYGFTLKYEQTGNNAMTMNVTEFIIGGVNVEGLIKLNDYEID